MVRFVQLFARQARVASTDEIGTSLATVGRLGAFIILLLGYAGWSEMMRNLILRPVLLLLAFYGVFPI
jgi:hypothetical protein